jgi:outer membrane receptor protein involved in Fe transport
MRISIRALSTRLTLLLALSVAFVPSLSAQGRGRIVGRVLDAATGAPLSGAQVSLVEQPTAIAVSAIDGRYTLMNIPAGAFSLRVRLIGYQAKVVSGMSLAEGAILSQDVTLTAQVVEIEAINVAAGAERGSVNAALEQQRAAPGIVNSVTAEQISRSPDGDAGQAVQRVSGVSVQDGKFVFVRGLGERYTTTSLNGARVPSPEPDRKVVPLDLFPSNLLEGVSTSKTFTPDQPGDFSGASVDLKTREFPTGRVYTLSTTAGFNAAVTGRDGTFAPSIGTEWRASAGDARALPEQVASLPSAPSPAQSNAAMASFRRTWLGVSDAGAPSGSVSTSVGGEDPLFGRLVGYIASFGYSNAQEVRHDEYRARAIDGDGAAGGALTVAQNAYRGTTTRTSVLMGGMLNLSTRIGATTKLSFNNTYTRGGDNEAVSLGGFNEEFNTPLLATRLGFISRSVRSNQVAAEHLFGNRHTISWQVTNAGVHRYEPDRSDYVQQGAMGADSLVDPAAWFGQGRSAYRSFSELAEEGWNLGLDYKVYFGEPGAGTTLKLGANTRSADRDVTSEAYSILNAALDDAARAQAPEAIFTDVNFASSSFIMQVDNQVGDYAARDRISAGYAMTELALGRRVRLVAGARVERAELAVTTSLPGSPATTARLATTDVLPSFAVNVGLSESQTLRFSATQTLSRPEYRELSGTTYREIASGRDVFGNPDLERALIQNFDARWEFYPRGGEIVSFGVFYKHFDRPIEKVITATTGADALTFVNAQSGYNAGLEVELRKRLDFLGDAFRPFSAFSNVTVMRSRVRFAEGQIGSSNAAERPMLGQAPYVVNAGLSWNTSGGWSATALYNVVGRRVSEGGSIQLPDGYEEERHVVDFSLRVPVMQAIEAKFDAKNLLDAEYATTQGRRADGSPNYLSRYTAGRVFQLGVSWKP